MRESLTAVSDDRRTRTVTRGHLEEALGALERAIKNPPLTPAECAGRLSDLAIRAATLDDIARTLADERGDAACAEMLSWVEAVSAAVQTHQRDVERLMPWAAVGRIEIMLPQAQGAGASGLGLLFNSIPTLADLPDLCEAAIGSVTEHPQRLLACLSHHFVSFLCLHLPVVVERSRGRLGPEQSRQHCTLCTNLTAHCQG